MFPQVNMLFSEMKTKIPELGRHCLAVAHLVDAVAIGSGQFEVSNWEIESAALLHDYAKLLWPPDLFYKDRQDLSLRDQDIISFHQELGRRLISVRWPRCPMNVLRLIEFHHNSGDWIPAQLLAACDVWVACHEDRPYRTRPVPGKIVLREMLRVTPEEVTGMVLEAIRIDFAYGPLMSM